MHPDTDVPLAAPRVPDRSSPASLWSQVRADMRRRCTDGTFDGGVPGEKALSQEYGVSRHTVREALRALRDEGVIRSQRGRMSTVRGGADVADTVFEVARRLEPAAASLLGLPSGSELTRVRRLEHSDGRVVAVVDTWLPVAVAEAVGRRT